MANTNRWAGNRGVYTPDKRMMGITNEQLDELRAIKETERKVAAIKRYQNDRLLIELNSIGRDPVECIDNGANDCVCRRCNTPMTASDDDELIY